MCSEGTLLGKLSQVLPGSLFQYVPNLCSTTQMLFQKIEITNVRLQTHFINCPLPHLLLICTLRAQKQDIGFHLAHYLAVWDS